MALFSDTVALVCRQDGAWLVDEYSVRDSTGWPMAVRELAERHSLKGEHVQLVLGHGRYQSLLIEKPELPREEYPTALPFLVKDLVNDSPSELVADGFVSPLKERLQVFVANKNLVESLVQSLREAGCELKGISVEEVVWGQFGSPGHTQLLLQRRGKGNLQLMAFKQQVLCFQRQLRGFAAPVAKSDPAPSDVMQLDGLALELQRSLDFLSAQLRDVPVTQVLVACDGEDDALLATALGERLNVKVAALSLEEQLLSSNALRVAYAGLHSAEQSNINLFSDSLKPKTELITLSNLAAGWGIAIVILAACAGWFSWQNYQQQQRLQAEQRLLDSANGALARAKEALAKHLPSQLKVDMAAGLEKSLASKQMALNSIAMHDESLKVGYGAMMEQLSLAANGNISLSHIRVSGANMDLEGMARTPDAVPVWLQQFDQYKALSERRFQQFSLGRDRKNGVTFTLFSDREPAHNSQGGQS
ncbi:PilN domain-containing protein [Photobacterium aquae]|nr:PilN domain-containing protein [Photobacterium aquae]